MRHFCSALTAILRLSWTRPSEPPACPACLFALQGKSHHPSSKLRRIPRQPCPDAPLCRATAAISRNGIPRCPGRGQRAAEIRAFRVSWLTSGPSLSPANGAPALPRYAWNAPSPSMPMSSVLSMCLCRGTRSSCLCAAALSAKPESSRAPAAYSIARPDQRTVENGSPLLMPNLSGSASRTRRNSASPPSNIFKSR